MQLPDWSSEYPPEWNAHIWRQNRSLAGALRCAILLDDCGGIEAWAQCAIDLLDREPRISIQGIYRAAGFARSTVRPGILFRWLNGWSHGEDSPLRRIDIQPPRGVPVSALNHVRELEEAHLDVLIWLETRPLAIVLDHLARLGVFSLRCGDPSHPPYWKELATDTEVTTIAWERSAGGSISRNSCTVATHPGLRVAQNAVEPSQAAALVLVRSLFDLLDAGHCAPEPVPSKSGAELALVTPGNIDALRILAKQGARTLRARLGSWRTPRWVVAIRSDRELLCSRRAPFSADGFIDVPAFHGSQFADPMLVEDRGANWLFVEEIPAGSSKGRLAVIELGSDGSLRPPVTVLEHSTHLSYPFVIRVERDFFMIPETSAKNTIELYRAVRFPFEWTLEKVLASKVRAVDTTAFLLDGTWYFFTTSARAGQETFLFWSASLDGDWHYHPANPICSDVRRARGAGPIFESGGSLVRPGQDCSILYGYAIALNRILKLSRTEYAEAPGEILPRWRKGLLATHTLSSNASFEAIDGLRYGP